MENRLATVLAQYNSDPLFVYKSCRNDWMLVLKKTDSTLEHTKKDKCKTSSRDKDYYAVHYGKEFLVVDIINKVTGECDETQINEFIDGEEVVYVKGELVSRDYVSCCRLRYRLIPYYRSYEAAYFKDQNDIFEGEFISWYDDGALKKRCSYNNGLLCGDYTEWYDNKQIMLQASYHRGNLHGIYTKYYNNGQIATEAHYQNGEKIGKFKQYDCTGRVTDMKMYAITHHTGQNDGHSTEV